MNEVYPNLFVGNENDCEWVDDQWAVIHACKHPCFMDSRDADAVEGLLTYEKKNHLYLNMVDMEQEPSFIPTLTMFRIAEGFIDYHKDKKVLVHCNQGRSRSPSLVLWYLARKSGILNAKNFDSAQRNFLLLYPYYKPTNGIRLFLTTNWNSII